MMNIELLRELTESFGPSGFEDATREIAQRELSSLGNVRVDALGNVICHRPGSGGPKVMIAAHLDEIGYLVKFIDEQGFLRLQTLGGWDPRQMNSQRVWVQSREGRLPGVLMYGTKPKHLLTEAEQNAGQKTEWFFVDLGLPVDEVKAKVRIGDPVGMNRPFQETGHLLTCKTMDDRVGVFVMIEAVRAVQNATAEIYAVATVQEEIGLRGAAAAGSALSPDIMIALDITLANDIPGVPETDHVTKLGAGAAIKIYDSSLICHPRLVAHFREVAERHGIPHQMEILPSGGTDAGAVQRLHGGIPSITLSIPTRYVHTVNETVHRKDVQACIDLLARYLEVAHEGNYRYH